MAAHRLEAVGARGRTSTALSAQGRRHADRRARRRRPRRLAHDSGAGDRGHRRRPHRDHRRVPGQAHRRGSAAAAAAAAQQLASRASPRRDGRERRDRRPAGCSKTSELTSTSARCGETRGRCCEGSRAPAVGGRQGRRLRARGGRRRRRCAGGGRRGTLRRHGAGGDRAAGRVPRARILVMGPTRPVARSPRRARRGSSSRGGTRISRGRPRAPEARHRHGPLGPRRSSRRRPRSSAS